jgi:glycosyltransferase involved in cell wall biosynthesis
MRVLHLLSEWKWTGPAEPTVSLCEGLHRLGVDVTIAYRKTPMDFPERTVGKEVARRRIPPHEGFRLNRYFSLKDWLADLRAIRQYVEGRRIDIVHTNLSHDHYLALLALARSGRKPLIVRTDHKRDGLPHDRFTDIILKKTDALVGFSDRIIAKDLKHFRFPPERAAVVPPGIRPYDGPITDLRGELGLTPTDRVAGIIGRLKPDRGYDVVLEAFKSVTERVEGAKLLIVGRSSQLETSIMEPLRKLGIEKNVILAGYRTDDYFSVIAAFDIFIMMRAGSDGTARALREVMGMGVPAIVSDAGILPELVEDGVSGYVVPPKPDVLARRIEALLADPDLRRQFGQNAAARARERWTYEGQAKEMASFYERLLRLGKRR